MIFFFVIVFILIIEFPSIAGSCANDMKALTKTLVEERERKDSGPLYLDEIDKLGPHQADLYLKVCLNISFK